MVGSREEAVINKVKGRARQYPWGTVEGGGIIDGNGNDATWTHFGQVWSKLAILT